MKRTTTLTTTIAAAVAALALTACQKNSDQTIGQKIDSTVQSAEQKARELKADAKQEGDGIAAKVKDAEITTLVNAELAKDKNLSALSINVDTSDGRVALKGSAPDVDSRDRATTLASAVKGVVAVDNQLTVTPKS